ncbi:hypothetical protein C3E98_039805, partial [Pseudomonas sp. MWU13-2625]
YPADRDLVDGAKRLVSEFREIDIPIGMRHALLDTAVDTVRGQGAAIRQMSFQDFGDAGVRVEIFVDEEASKRCGEINWAIADAICERFDHPRLEFLAFLCRPLQSYHMNGEIISGVR